MEPQTSILLRLPREILENIGCEVAAAAPLGRVSNPLLFTCRFLYETFSIDSPQSSTLYARIFRAKFDASAIARRYGPRALRSSNLAWQLREYCETLDFFERHRNIYAHDLQRHFMNAFLMMVESDGKNWVQLERVGLAGFVDDFVRNRLWSTADALNAGWPEETTLNSLALWLVWFTTTKERLLAESEQDRANMIAMVMPYVELAFRYPAFHAPDNHYYFPLPEEYHNNFPASVRTAHGRWPLYRNASAIKNVVRHFGREFTVSTPLISQAAKLIYFSRREVRPIMIPQHLPVNRDHALALGHLFGPTQEDVREFNAYPQAKLLPVQRWDWEDDFSEEQLELDRRGVWNRDLKTLSARWDNDWVRWTHCYDLLREPEFKGVVYTYGMLNGLWQGRLLVASEPTYMALVTTAQRPPTFLQNDPFITGRPIYMRLHEHHCIDPQDPVPVGGADDDFDDGITNGWFPPTRQYHEHHGKLTWVTADNRHYTYETFVEGRSNSHNEGTCRICVHHAAIEEEEGIERARAVSASLNSSSDGTASPPPNSPHTHEDFEEDFIEAGLGRGEDDDDDDYVYNECSGITDIIFTGNTEDRHGRAWDYYRYYGRIRAWDGLIALVRVRVDPEGHDDPREGKLIIRGYVVAGQNFVGTWRSWAPDVNSFPLEGPIVLSKRE